MEIQERNRKRCGALSAQLACTNRASGCRVPLSKTCTTTVLVLDAVSICKICKLTTHEGVDDATQAAAICFQKGMSVCSRDYAVVDLRLGQYGDTSAQFHQRQHRRRKSLFRSGCRRCRQSLWHNSNRR